MIKRQQSIVQSRQSIVHGWQSIVDSRQSIVDSRQSIVNSGTPPGPQLIFKGFTPPFGTGGSPLRRRAGWGAFLFLIFLSLSSNAQSVGYYPWNGLLTVSTNPYKPVWLDVRLQTNTLFGSLSTEILPMVNLTQTEVFQTYLGGGIRFNFIGAIAGTTKNVVEGYALNVGVRVAPFKTNRNIKVALELSPYVQRKLDSGILKTNFGIVYVFGK